MQFTVKSLPASGIKTDCLVLGVFEAGSLPAATAAVDKASGGHLKKTLARAGFAGQADKTLVLFDIPGAGCDRLLLVGLGKQADFDLRAYRKAATAAARALAELDIKDAVSHLAQLPAKDLDAYWKARHLLEASEAALYRFDLYKSGKRAPKAKLAKITLAAGGNAETRQLRQGLEHGAAISAGVALARELGNLPGNVCTPAYLAQQARALAKQQPRIKVSVLEEAQMKKLGMGALLSVSRGSRQPAKLIIMEYKGGKAGEKPHVLVGKGITFDSGGISIKPGAQMDEMKFDMCGAASVLGTLKTAALLNLKINIVGAIAASENLPDGNASKPGDIVTTMSGQTVEILNTDAEGRLVLCDTLTYIERFKPASVVDIATLTGACVIALGAHASGLLTQDEELARRLLAAGEQTGDRAWRLPLWDEYQEQLNSNFADMANIGGREAGTITAGCFLSRFTKSYRWAHLDIAGTAWLGGAQKGGTGRPVPLLTQYLLNQL